MPDQTERLNELEARLAFLENTQEELSGVLAEQSQLINQLRERVERQKHQLLELAENLPEKPTDDVPPPHY